MILVQICDIVLRSSRAIFYRFSRTFLIMSNSTTQPALDDIVALCKRRGFVYPTSEIYGGLANSYDYGPLGSELLRNIRNLWWKEFIHKRRDMVGLDSQILLHPQTWVASGHVGSFSDPLVEDTVTAKRYRADHLIEAWLKNEKNTAKLAQKIGADAAANFQVENLKIDEMAAFISEQKILSPDGNPVTEPRSFNLLFETAIGAVSGEKAKIYLRGETAQGIFSNFKQILDSTRVQLPFGVGQIGKSFRNEITTGQFIFRTLELEQAEIEYFFNPAQTNWEELFENWKKAMWSFATQTLGVKNENLRWRRHTDKERSHYSKDTYDLDYNFSFGWKELWGIAYRTDYDLKQHVTHSGKSLEYTDPFTGEKTLPHVIEPALGINRAFLMVLTDAYFKDEERNRTVLKLSPALAPYKIAVFPLVKNKPEILAKAEAIFAQCVDIVPTVWDDRGNIGKRYLSQDEIGTPACLTIDYQTLEDNTVTWRDRDTAEQVRMTVDEALVKLRTMA
jgi:glycyl-tRNA synthetase